MMTPMPRERHISSSAFLSRTSIRALIWTVDTLPPYEMVPKNIYWYQFATTPFPLFNVMDGPEAFDCFVRA